MDAIEQTNGWFESLSDTEKEEVFTGLSPDPVLWWDSATLVDKNNLMSTYSNLGTIPKPEPKEDD